VGGSKVELFVITGHNSEALTSHFHSQQEAGFVVPRTTACWVLALLAFSDFLFQQAFGKLFG